MIKVFKFGGASVKDADSVRNVGNIIKNHAPKELVVVVSAMGKTTNALEKVVYAWYNDTSALGKALDEVIKFHQHIISDLFGDNKHAIFAEINHIFNQLNKQLETAPFENFNYAYDCIVSYGEMLSTAIMHAYLNATGFNCKLFDVRKLIRTDEAWREGNVDWEYTEKQINGELMPFFKESSTHPAIALTQGFLGGTKNGHTTTLGREGSDYTAAIFSYVLNATEMIVWKDVPGVLNADPKFFDKTILLQHISYREAIELTYYGATVIHPKTIKPLQNKEIPLRVRSFVNPDESGTLISQSSEDDNLCASIILKSNQVLISFSPKDFSFIAENNLKEIFTALADLHVRVNMMQTSAISFSICVDNDVTKINRLFALLEEHFTYKYNEDLKLITIRNYTQQVINDVLKTYTLLVEQRSRQTAQYVVKS